MRVLLVLATVLVAMATAEPAVQCELECTKKCTWFVIFEFCYDDCRCKPVNGGYSEWKTFQITECSVTCGNGTYTITQQRHCNNPPPSSDGNNCTELGPSTRLVVERCENDPCPVNGGYSEWNDISNTGCSVTRGNGTITITQQRHCNNPPPSNGGNDCTELGPSVQTVNETCVNGGYSEWKFLGRSACSVSCGNGTYTVRERRKCNNPPPSNHGKNCKQQKLGPVFRKLKKICERRPCPVDGGWSNWTISQGECSKSCGGGTRTVTGTRTCTQPEPTDDGLHCDGNSTRTSYEDCNSQNCPVDGGWSDWQSVSMCSVLCGNGTENQTRTCTNPVPQHGGNNCSSEGNTEHRTYPCNDDDCEGKCPDGENTFIEAVPPPDHSLFYYRCVPGDGHTVKTVAILQRCHPNLVWSQAKMTCVREHEVVAATTTPAITTTTTASSTITATTASSTITATTATLSCKAGDLLPDPDNCSKFFLCGDKDEKTRMSCALGTKFDKSISTCNHESLVTC